MDQRQQPLPLLNSRQYGYENGNQGGGSSQMGPSGARLFRIAGVALSNHIQRRAWLDVRNELGDNKVARRWRATRTIELQLAGWGNNTVALLREGFDTADSSFQCLLRSVFFLGANIWKLLLKLMTSEFIDRLPHIFRIIL